MPFHRRLKFSIVVLCFAGEVCFGQAKSQEPDKAQIRASARLTDWDHNGIGGLGSLRVAFLTEDSLAIYVCSGECRLFVANISGRDILPTTARTAPGLITSLHRAGTEGILAWPIFGFKTKLYSSDLQIETQMPRVMKVSRTGATLAVVNGTRLIDIYKSSEMRQAESTTSINEYKLESISDDLLLHRQEDRLILQTFDGKVLSSIAVKPKNKCATSAEILAKDRLYLSSCYKDSIIDFRGNRLVPLKGPSGDGTRLRWDGQGTRILFERSIRDVFFLRRAGELTLALATLGLGVGDEEPNVLAIRVIETSTGHICFDWRSLKHTIGQNAVGYEPHADISPGGRSVAIAMDDALTVYAIPDQCGRRAETLIVQ